MIQSADVHLFHRLFSIFKFYLRRSTKSSDFRNIPYIQHAMLRGCCRGGRIYLSRAQFTSFRRILLGIIFDLSSEKYRNCRTAYIACVKRNLRFIPPRTSSYNIFAEEQTEHPRKFRIGRIRGYSSLSRRSTRKCERKTRYPPARGSLSLRDSDSRISREHCLRIT